MNLKFKDNRPSPRRRTSSRTADSAVSTGRRPAVKAIAQQTQRAEGGSPRCSAPQDPRLEQTPAPRRQAGGLGQERRRLARCGHTRAARHHLPDSMVPHHFAAVPMSQSEVERGTYQPATELAETSGRTQRMEIMKCRR
ncbi:MAG: DUF305 domain-containing protein [Mycobacteriales bacterium]